MAYILLLEDIDSDAREIESAVKQIGAYEVKRFDRPARAIESLSDMLQSGSELPLLIVADLNLPGSSGYELLRFYHANPELQSVPCAVWSVLDGETEKKMTTWMGAKKLISKNSGPTTLRKSLASLLNSEPEQNSRRLPPGPPRPRNICDIIFFLPAPGNLS